VIERTPQQVLKDGLAQRQMAYKCVFEAKNQFSQTVMNDLERFCRAKESTYSPDARTHALLEGRREVYLRILEHVDLGFDQLYAKYRAIKPEEDEDA